MMHRWLRVALIACVRAVAAAVCLAGSGSAFAREELETDRDSFTFAPTTAGTGLSILE
jgi:hypothetical protein